MTHTNRITKTIIQTSESAIPKYVKQMILDKMSEGWEYLYFNDDDARQFISDNPLEDFPTILDKFNELQGPFKADLFRYYYLYVKGGVYIDSDGMFEKNIQDIARKYSFFSSEYQEKKDDSCQDFIFQGLIASSPGHPIMYDALKDICNISQKELYSDYQLVCRNLFPIVERYRDYPGVRLYNEIYFNDETTATYDHIDDSIVAFHYYKTKIIPNKTNMHP